MPGWYFEKGPQSDVVISSRVRLARNLSRFPFPHRMNREQEAQVLNIVKDSILNNKEAGKEFMFINLNEINPVDKQVLVEKHLMSPEMVENQRLRGLLLSRDEKVSIMVNEEDHLRIQCLFPGMNIKDARSSFP
jgi:protein arginine kinase